MSSDTSYLHLRDHRYNTLKPPPLPPKEEVKQEVNPTSGLYFPKPVSRPPSYPLHLLASPTSSTSSRPHSTTLDEGQVYRSRQQSAAQPSPAPKQLSCNTVDSISDGQASVVSNVMKPLPQQPRRHRTVYRLKRLLDKGLELVHADKREEAINHLCAALAEQKDTVDHSWQTAVRINLGILYLDASQYRKATTVLQQAWQDATATLAASHVIDHVAITQSLALCETMGRLCFQLSNYARAVDFYDRGIRIVETYQHLTADSPDVTLLPAYCRLLSHYALAEDALGHLAVALHYHDRALHAVAPLPTSHQTSVRWHMSETLLANGQLILGLAALRHSMHEKASSRITSSLIDLHRILALVSINQEKRKLDWRRESKVLHPKGRIQALLPQHGLNGRRDSTATQKSFGAKSVDLGKRLGGQKKLSFTKSSGGASSLLNHKMRSKSMDNLKAFQAPLVSLKPRLHQTPSVSSMQHNESVLTNGAWFMRKTMEKNLGVVRGLERFDLSGPSHDDITHLKSSLQEALLHLKVMTQRGDGAAMCYAQRQAGYACITLHWLTQAALYFEAALRLAKSRQHKRDEMDSVYAIGLTAFLQHDFCAAHTAFSSALQLANHIGDRLWQGRIQYMIADTLECVLICVEEDGGCSLGAANNQPDDRRHRAALRKDLVQNGGTCHIAEIRRLSHEALLEVLGWCDACYRLYAYPALSDALDHPDQSSVKIQIGDACPHQSLCHV